MIWCHEISRFGALLTWEDCKRMMLILTMHSEMLLLWCYILPGTELNAFCSRCHENIGIQQFHIECKLWWIVDPKVSLLAEVTATMVSPALLARRSCAMETGGEVRQGLFRSFLLILIKHAIIQAFIIVRVHYLCCKVSQRSRREQCWKQQM